MHKNLKGFTLIELIVVIGIIAILGAITIVAVNPARQFASARNAQRQNDVLAILDAIQQHAADNNGTYLTSVTNATVAKCIGTGASCVDLSSLAPTYFSSVPTDPGGPSLTAGSAADSKYTVLYSTTSSVASVKVAAPNAELSKTISVSR